MRTPEGIIADCLLRRCAERGLFVRKVRWEGRAGCPDYIVITQNGAYFIEAKAPREKPRPSQDAEFEAIRRAGCPVFVVDSPAAADDALDRIQAGGDVARLDNSGIEALARRIAEG